MGPGATRSMGLTHCPLCVGLAVLCLVQGGAHALLLWRLLHGDPEPKVAPQPIPRPA